MATTSLLPRGFKSKSEKMAVAFRKNLDLLPHDPLCAFELAKHLGVSIYPTTDFFNSEQIKLLDGWSALTMITEKKNKIIIQNQLHAATRQQSNVMHELAHIICEHTHPPAHKEVNLPYYMRGFNKQHEEEANCLGYSLQITRDGLLWALKKRMSISDIATHYNASEAVVNLRINSTGVKRQLSYL